MQEPLKKTFTALLLGIALLAGNAMATTYEYDQLNRLKRVTYDNGTVIEYTYDASGNRTARRIDP